MRDSRRAIRDDGEALLERADAEPLVLGVGEVLPFSPTRRRAASLPVDVARTIEEALGTLPLDIVHVHEPFAPSASSVALRHSRALNVGSFHAPTERILSTQLTRPLSRLLFSRLDARTASYGATRDLLQRYFPGDYRGDPARGRSGDAADREPARGASSWSVIARAEERAALRLFLRALRALPREPEWRATVWSPRPLTPPATLSRALRDRVQFVDAERMPEAQALAQPTCSCSPRRGCGRRRGRWCARWPPAWSPSPRGWRPTRSSSARASAGFDVRARRRADARRRTWRD